MSDVKSKWVLWAMFGLAVALIGCGGSGGGSTTSSTSVTNGATDGGATVPGVITITPTAREINYGDSVTLNWTSQRIDAITSSNFGATTLNGTFEDHPTSDTDYSIRGADSAPPHEVRKGLVTIRVRKTDKSYLIVGDVTTDVGLKIDEYVRMISNNVTSSVTLPASPTTDAVVILVSANVTPADSANVESYLAAGGSVILLAEAPRKLATGDLRETNVSAISSWFGGATRLSWDYRWPVFADIPEFHVSRLALGKSYGNAYGVKTIEASGIRITQLRTETSAFAYRPSMGGRLFYAGAYGPTNSDNDKVQKAIFLAGCRWATEE